MAGRPKLLQIAKEQYGLELNPGPWGINSRPALVGAKYAEGQGKGEAYHKGVLWAYWHEGKSIEDLDVLSAVAVEAGLDKTDFLNALADPVYDNAVRADIQQAYEYQITGVPALIFVNKYLVPGAQPYPVLKDIVEKIESGQV